MPDSRLGELYLETLTNAGAPVPVTQPQASRLGELYLEALTNAAAPSPVTLPQAGQLAGVYLEVLTAATPLVIPWADTAAGSDGTDSYSPLIKADQATYYYPMDEPVGTQLRDRITGSTTATDYNLTRSAPPAANLPGHAVVNNGASWSSISFGYDDRSYGPSQTAVSVEVWVRITAGQLGGWSPTVVRVGGGVIQLFMNPDGTLLLQLQADGIWNYPTGKAKLADGRWHHVVITTTYRTDPAGAVNTRVYVDGRVDIAAYTQGASPYLGYWSFELGQQYGVWAGDFDQFALYLGTELSPAQVAKHYSVATLVHEQLLSISHVALADAATVSDAAFGAETVLLPGDTATATDTLRALVLAPPGPRLPRSPDPMNSANTAALRLVRVDSQISVTLDPLDGGNDVQLDLAAPTSFAVTLASASLVAVSVRYRAVVPALELHSANRAALSVRTLGGGHDPVPVSLSPSPDAAITVSDNPAMRLVFSSQARLLAVPGGVGRDPAYDPLAGLDPSALSDQEEDW